MTHSSSTSATFVFPNSNFDILLQVERLQHAEEKRQWAMQQMADADEAASKAAEAPELQPEPVPETGADVHMAEAEADPRTENELEARPGLGNALRTALKAAAEVESTGRVREKGGEKRKRDKVMKPSSPAKSKTGKRTREGSGTGREKEKEKKARSGSGGSNLAVASKATDVPPAEPDPSAAPPVPPIPPTTPRSLHPAAQRARARHYAPAVPSPLSRILTMAASPEGRGVGSEVLGGELKMDAPEQTKSPRRSMRVSGAKSPGRSPGKVVKGAGLAVKFAAAAAKEKKSKGEKKARVKPAADNPQATDVEPEAETSKGKEKATEAEAQEKEDGRDLDAIFAPRAEAPKAGPSSKPMRVAVAAPKRVLTPRKAAVGGTRAKRAGASWKG
jgi:hypothetical protein